MDGSIPATPLDDCSATTGFPSGPFITTGDVNWFEELGRRLLGPELERAEHLYWD